MGEVATIPPISLRPARKQRPGDTAATAPKPLFDRHATHARYAAALDPSALPKLARRPSVVSNPDSASHLLSALPQIRGFLRGGLPNACPLAAVRHGAPPA